MPYGYVVKGLDALLDNISNVSKNMSNYINKAMVEAVTRVQSDARDLSPQTYKYSRPTGNLRRSILTNISDGGLTGIVYSDPSIAATAGKWNGVGYGVFQEFGTRFISPTHFMEQALDTNTEYIQQLFDKAIELIVKDMAQ
jgi:HK97 gp10 family phage protein